MYTDTDSEKCKQKCYVALRLHFITCIANTKMYVIRCQMASTNIIGLLWNVIYTVVSIGSLEPLISTDVIVFLFFFAYH